MILLLDTSTPVCKLTFVDGDVRSHKEWQADRSLAKGLLDFINTCLHDQSKTWKDLSGIGVFQGPGSFTGLRIGLTVLNTIADAEQIPIVGTKGEDWQSEALIDLESGKNDRLVLPFYGSDAHITLPRK